MGATAKQTRNPVKQDLQGLLSLGPQKKKDFLKDEVNCELSSEKQRHPDQLWWCFILG